MAVTCGNVMRLLVVLVIALGELAFICYLAWQGHLYLDYFTYVNKVIFMITVWLVVAANVDYLIFQWLAGILVPFLAASGLLVGVGVTILAMCQPLLVAQDVDGADNDPAKMAEVHTADWLLHQLPFFEAVIIAFCLYKQLSCSIRYHLEEVIPHAVPKTLYILLACCLHLVVVGIYCATSNFTVVYMLGTGEKAVLPVLWLIAVALAASLAVYCMFFIGVWRHVKPKHSGETLMTVAAPAVCQRIRTHLLPYKSTKQAVSQDERARNEQCEQQQPPQRSTQRADGGESRGKSVRGNRFFHVPTERGGAGLR